MHSPTRISLLAACLVAAVLFLWPGCALEESKTSAPDAARIEALQSNAKETPAPGEDAFLRPGPVGDGSFVLPNGRLVRPAGSFVTTPSFPNDVGVSPDGRIAVLDGRAQGVEFFMQKKRGALTGWAGYTLSTVNNTFSEFNNGASFPALHDRTHEINLVAKYSRGVYTFAATWVYATGSPYTAPESQYFVPLLNGETQSYIHVSDKNSLRLPDYQRLDLSASRKFESTQWATEIGISIFNAYNHQNVWYRDYNLDTTPISVTDVLMMGFTPTLFLQMTLK